MKRLLFGHWYMSDKRVVKDPTVMHWTDVEMLGTEIVDKDQCSRGFERFQPASIWLDVGSGSDDRPIQNPGRSVSGWLA